MNQSNVICFDLETSGLKIGHHEVIEIAAKAYDIQTLKPFPDGEFGPVIMRPLHMDRVDRRALSINKITIEELENGADQKATWLAFVNWVKGFRVKGRDGTPIAAGKNIRKFDLKFVECLNELHFKKKTKEVFHPRLQLDLEDFIYGWFSGQNELPDMSMDTLRGYFGLEAKGAHRAMVDVQQTGELIMKFLRLQRELRNRKGKDGEPLIKFKNSCAGL